MNEPVEKKKSRNALTAMVTDYEIPDMNLKDFASCRLTLKSIGFFYLDTKKYA